MIIKNIIRNNSLNFRGFFTYGFLLLFLLISTFAFSQTAEDEKNYQVCKACHTIGGGQLVGPDLKDISDRRDEAWIISFVQNSQQMVLKGDEQAVKVFNENNKIPMPSNSLSDDQVRGILLYISNDGKLAAGEVSASQESTEVIVAEDTAQLIVEMRRDEQQNMMWVFLVMAILFVISVLDLSLLKIVKSKVDSLHNYTNCSGNNW